MFLGFRFSVVCLFYLWLTNLQVSSNYFDLYRRPRGSKILASVLGEKLRNFKSVNLISYSNSKGNRVTYSQDEERIIHLLVKMLSAHNALYISCIQSEKPKTFFESTTNIYVIQEKSLTHENFLQRFPMLAPLRVIIAITSICDEGLREVKEFYENINDTNNMFVFRYCSGTKRGHFKYVIYKVYNLNTKIKDQIEILEVNSSTNLNKPPFQFEENVLQRIAYQDTKIPEIEVSENFTKLETLLIINFDELKDSNKEKHNQHNFSKILLKDVKNVIFFENVKQMSYIDTREFDYAISISQKDCTLLCSSSIPFYKQLLQNFHYSNWIFLTALLLLSMLLGELINDHDWRMGYDNNFVVFNTKGSSKIPWRLKVLTWIEIILRQPIRYPSNLGSPQKVFIGSLFIIGATFYESFQVRHFLNIIIILFDLINILNPVITYSNLISIP